MKDCGSVLDRCRLHFLAWLQLFLKRAEDTLICGDIISLSDYFLSQQPQCLQCTHRIHSEKYPPVKYSITFSPCRPQKQTQRPYTIYNVYIEIDHDIWKKASTFGIQQHLISNKKVPFTSEKRCVFTRLLN